MLGLLESLFKFLFPPKQIKGVNKHSIENVTIVQVIIFILNTQ